LADIGRAIERLPRGEPRDRADTRAATPARPQCRTQRPPPTRSNRCSTSTSRCRSRAGGASARSTRAGHPSSRCSSRSRAIVIRASLPELAPPLELDPVPDLLALDDALAAAE